LGVSAGDAGAAAGFFAFVTMTTRKSLGFMPHDAIVSSSFSTFPE
jgi:hypothetical protein